MVRGMEIMFYEEQLKELRTFSLGKERLAIAHIYYIIVFEG